MERNFNYLKLNFFYCRAPALTRNGPHGSDGGADASGGHLDQHGYISTRRGLYADPMMTGASNEAINDYVSSFIY